MESSSMDRRRFLGRAAALAAAAPVLPLAACGAPDARERGDTRRGDDGAEGGPLTQPPARPVLVLHGEDAVHLWAPPRERPLAYVSMADHQVFVDRAFRDRIYWLLDAHISVSSGLWRIPLPGDDPRVPIVPDDRLREFEERPMRAWDPAGPTAEGDVRVLRGVPVRQRLAFGCAPLSGGDAWLAAGPLEVVRCGGAGPEACREDFMQVGVARRFADRRCSEPAGSLRLLTWACRDG